ncbi:hypothetical protein [Helicobacter pametensis]|uniref:hypothetical protein n=1 Tax=Helicobacter pametensis TaxID=95149 RepID=UPI0004B6175B|nr:hypothetical protein [Helicobacter pametensis]
MRFFGIFCLLIIAVWACQGDCASCHTTLDYKHDFRHQPMQECKNCHTEEKMSQIDMGACGQDCFACHDAQKLLKPELSEAHKVIQQCINCHTSLNPLDFSAPLQLKPNPTPFFLENPLLR